MSSRSTWRDWIRPQIAAAIAEAEQLGLEGKDKVRFVRAYSPGTAQGHWPYKVWCSEVRAQLKLRRRGHVDHEMPLFDHAREPEV